MDAPFPVRRGGEKIVNRFLHHLLPWLLPAIAEGTTKQSIANCPWLVVDCESSGLDPRRDRLLEMAYVPVNGHRIALGESFEGVLQQAVVSSVGNILIHRISGRRQLNGESPARLMQQFAAALQGRVVVGFHAGFDRELSARALRRFALQRLRGDWLDLADLAPALMPDLAPRCRTLDDWLAALNISVAGRHRAAGDALATAQLLLRLLACCASDATVQTLFDAARAHRQLCLLRNTPH